MKDKMLYMSHVDWRWIKQRPHFLAEGLSEYFDVSVMYMFQNRNRKNLQKRDISGQNTVPLFSIPMAGKVKLVGSINRAFAKAQFALQVKRVKPRYLYLTYPTQYEFLPRSYTGTVVYDCMDDHAAMIGDDRKAAMLQCEKALIDRADVVLVSSRNLQRVLLDKYGPEQEQKMHLIRNGYSGEILGVPPKQAGDTDRFTISYIGTVGRWFNFEFILKSLEDIPNLHYNIIGPCDFEAPQADRLHYAGTVEHDKLYDAVKTTDCLMMPFVVNDIVASVDPVKLYEYINFNMNILCVNYPEIQRFEPFVYFYDDYDSFLAQIKSMMGNNTIRYDGTERERFLKENNWDSRTRRIVEILQGNR